MAVPFSKTIVKCFGAVSLNTRCLVYFACLNGWSCLFPDKRSTTLVSQACVVGSCSLMSQRYRAIFKSVLFSKFVLPRESPQWGAADAEIKVPSGENTELKRSPFEAWSRSVYSHTCYAYCQECLPCLFLPFQSIHLHFFQNLSRNFSCVGCS